MILILFLLPMDFSNHQALSSSAPPPKKNMFNWLTGLFSGGPRRKAARAASGPVFFDGDTERQKGKGFTYKGKEFIHHTDLNFYETAFYRLLPGQKNALIAMGVALGLLLLLEWRTTVITILAALTLLYFVDLMFNVFLIIRSFSKSPALRVHESELADLRDADLPEYTIFCPLYREWQVVPQFIRAIGRLQYPKDKLQVMLLLEEDDQETISKVSEYKLPDYFEVVVVPHSLPKTKPKAMNYGLSRARGEFTVVYDAEDVPEPMQLKKAVLTFRKVQPETICIQAKLNYYNPKQNLLTRVFTAEYSLWFDLILPGLQSMNAPIPLGGTSNHFRTENLRRLKGWDAFNVTEDCDLGMRIAKWGHRTAIMESVTLEEANSNPKNWLNQRSRWVKGYIQTYLVHMRRFQENSPRWNWMDWVSFQLVVGGKVMSLFVNPVLWVVTAVYFLFRTQAGEFIESFFPTPVMYLGVPSLVFGNFLYLYVYMVGLAKRGQYSLIKYAFLVPFYWLGMSVAAWKALYEMVVKPHYWAKTVHGLHLKGPARPPQGGRSPLPDTESEPRLAGGNQPVAAARMAMEDQKDSGDPQTGKWLWSRKLLTSGSVLIGVTVAANALNFLLSAYLSRTLSPEHFGVLALFNSFAFLAGIVVTSLATAVNHETARAVAGEGDGSGERLLNSVQRWVLLLSLGISVAWVAAVPLLARFFQVSDASLFLWFAPAFVFAGLMAAQKGYLQGKFLFVSVAAIVLMESVTKLAGGVLLVERQRPELVALSIPLSIVTAWVLGSVFILVMGRRRGKHAASGATAFPFKFFFASLLGGASVASFLSLDVMLAKHYLDARLAGEYALLSLVGKVIFLLGSLLGGFVTTYISYSDRAKQNPSAVFFRLFAATALLTFGAFVLLGPLGNLTVPLLLGAKTGAILPYLNIYALGIALFTLSNAVVLYHLARRQYVYTLFPVVTVIAMAVGLYLHHGSIRAFTEVLLAVSVGSFAAIAATHFWKRSGRFIVANIVDFLDVVFPLKPYQGDGQRILIFNWRDPRHVFAGGAELYIFELAKRWASEGNQVTLFCGNDGNSPRNEAVDGVQVVRRGGFYTVYLWAAWYYLIQFRGKYDVIVDCQNGVPFFTPLFAKEPIYCLMHHVHQEVFRRYLPKPLALFAAFLERRVMPWAYRRVPFITISESSRQAMQALGLGGAGIEVVPPGANLGLLRPGRQDEQPLVLYLGRLKGYKSVDVLLRAFGRVKSRVPNARLAVVGSGDDERRLKQLVRRLGLEDDVIFTGKVAEREKVNWLQRAWVFVNPSLMEGWGITTIEANACGIPVVASNVPGLRDSVRNPHTGFLVPYGNAEALADKITCLLIDPKLRVTMGRNALQWAQGFDWYRSSSSFLNILKRGRHALGRLAAGEFG